MTTSKKITPVSKSRVVPLSPEEAFSLFTERMGEWWPLPTHSIEGEDAVGVRFETGVGGVVVELVAGGGEHIWAEVTEWDPPHRFALDWHPSLNPRASSTLEITFSAVEGGTRLDLHHHGWEGFGREALELRAQYETGWDGVLAAYHAG